jgi:hydroxymethylpyrimidine/phosphomethylpyrimidine kinase
LSIAGSDSGGGAGLQADWAAFAALGVHGLSAVTCLTAQNPEAVRGVLPCRADFLRAQLEAVFEAFPVRAIKTGMLYSAALIRTTAETLARHAAGIPLVVDPVMVATSGSRLLKPAALRALTEELLPRATVITPNRDEASVLLGRPLRELADLREAARGLHGRFGCAALVKGGHCPEAGEAVDVLWDGRRELLLRAPFHSGAGAHGSGCALAAALAAGLARGDSLPRAVRRAKAHVSGCIAHRVRVGRHETLNHFAAVK